MRWYHRLFIALSWITSLTWLLLMSAISVDKTGHWDAGICVVPAIVLWLVIRVMGWTVCYIVDGGVTPPTCNSSAPARRTPSLR